MAQVNVIIAALRRIRNLTDYVLCIIFFFRRDFPEYYNLYDVRRLSDRTLLDPKQWTSRSETVDTVGNNTGLSGQESYCF